MTIYGTETTDLLNQNATLETLPADAIVRWAVETYAPQLALTCSFGGPSGMVLLDLVMQVDRSVPVLVIDTGLLFGDTYAVVDAVERRYNISVQRVRPSLSVAEQDARYGPELFSREPDQCCRMRKVEPLAAALTPYAAWLTALRRDQSSTRANTPVVAWNAKHALVKVCPLATWSERDVWRYIHAHKLPYNQLLDQGYTSLGCHTCTSLPLSDDPRSGRWTGFAKTECGLHL